MTADPAHLAWAAVIVIVWLAASSWWLRPARGRAIAADATLILYASQTGQALEIAEASLRRLQEGGQSAVAMPLGQVIVDQLTACSQLLVIASTTGIGEAPDDARAFVARMAQAPDLSAVHYAVLALGDRRYEDFCAFGVRVDGWLAAGGARALHDRIDVDDLAAESLHQWNNLLDTLGAVEAPAVPSLYTPWRVDRRELLNPASRGDASMPGLW